MPDSPIRVLQVVGRTDRGGAETWLLHAMRHIDRREVAMDFLVYTDNPGAYDEEIVERGGRILVCPRPRNLVRQLFRMRCLQKLYGPYDVVHSHVDYYGGIVSLLTLLLGFRVRIVHSHNDTTVIDRAAGLPRRFYTNLMKLFTQWFATAGIATSRSAASLMFGNEWSSSRRWRVLPACVDLSSFSEPIDRGRIRSEFGIDDGAIVFGHVGRFVHQKNHDFIIQVAKRLSVKETRSKFVLVGSGPTRAHIEREIRTNGLDNYFIILDPRDDIPRLMLGLFDFFLFPSIHEGLGLALIEAQAAGLRCFTSEGLPSEGIVIPDLVCKIPLSVGPDAWTDQICDQIRKRTPIAPRRALESVQGSFDIRKNARQLADFYHEAVS
jgi:glycosyltransferase involved in cell wall biosynthesis